MVDPKEKAWRRVLLQDPCVYCGAPADGLDHIRPKSQRGGEHWFNRAPACRQCDGEKGPTPLVFFLVARQNAIDRSHARPYETERMRNCARLAMLRTACRAFYQGNIRQAHGVNSL